MRELPGLQRKRAAGSPKARFELENDPLGLAARAAQPVWETVAISETFNLTSPDGTAMIIPVITNQSGSLRRSVPRDNAGCASLHHRDHARSSGPAGPEIGVTGRSAYVEEIEQSMQRDIAMTSVVSLFCVTGSVLGGLSPASPLIGIALLLGAYCRRDDGGGALYFDKLNIIAISFCSILFGLGDDFSLLLCQRVFPIAKCGNDRETAIAEFDRPLRARDSSGALHDRDRLSCALL